MEKILKNAMVTSNDCPLCGSNMIIELFEAKDWLVTQQNFTIYGCKSCDLQTHALLITTYRAIMKTKTMYRIVKKPPTS